MILNENLIKTIIKFRRKRGRPRISYTQQTKEKDKIRVISEGLKTEKDGRNSTDKSQALYEDIFQRV